MNGLISIVIPVYNAEKYIRESIESVIRQSYENLEIILVDDGSTDATGLICDGYAQTDDRIFSFHKENGGASSARNFGLCHVHGDYVYFVDSDDFLMPEALQSLVTMAEEEHLDCIYFEADNFSETNGIQANADGFTFYADYPVSDGKELIPNLLRNKDYHAAPFLYFMKADILQNIRFEEGIMLEDELFSFQLLRACHRVKCQRQKFYRRRMREGSVMTSTGKGIFRFHSISTVFEKIQEIYNETPSYETVTYIERIGILWFARHDELTAEEKKHVEVRFNTLSSQMRNAHYFGSFQLRFRVMGFMPWFIVTMPERITRKIRQHLKRMCA